MNRLEKQSASSRAAAYGRMSTDHQRYSISNQMETIREYARRRGLEIVRVYSDEGKSGLDLQGRDALSQMLRDVQSGEADFSTILVYDVSRWGRFQDTDESAYYEYLCRQAGVQVLYCAEQFENDGSPVSTIVKSVKRAMAAEYSRELSNKVFQGACRLAQMGYKLGGTSGFGMRRMLVDQNGQHKGILHPGEQKNISTDRVILVPGPEEEIKVVQWIYRLFIDDDKGEAEIARVLNAGGVLTESGHTWNREKVHAVLTNEKYIGNNVYHRKSCKLKAKRVPNPPEKWVRAEGVFQGIIERERFVQAQKKIRARHYGLWSDEEVLAKLRSVLQQHGRLTCQLIDQAKGLPSSNYLTQRFGGSVLSLYRRLGFQPRLDYSDVRLRSSLLKKTRALALSLVDQIEKVGVPVQWKNLTRTLLIHNELRVRLLLMRHNVTSRGNIRWFIRLREEQIPDLILAARMDARNESILDYYLLPALDPVWRTHTFADANGVYLDTYRFPSLDTFLGLLARGKLPEAVCMMKSS